MSRPVLHVIGGPNGSGKSTFCVDYIPAVGDPPFFNADVLAAERSPNNPNAALVDAGRELFLQIEECLATRKSFVLETTLAGRTYLRLLRRARAMGFEIVVNFLWIETAAQSAARVAARVEQGGHNVPRDAIFRRHALTRKNFFQLYLPLAHEWRLYDNSSGEMHMLAYTISECYDVEGFDRCFVPSARQS